MQQWRTSHIHLLFQVSALKSVHSSQFFWMRRPLYETHKRDNFSSKFCATYCFTVPVFCRECCVVMRVPISREMYIFFFCLIFVSHSFGYYEQLIVNFKHSAFSIYVNKVSFGSNRWVHNFVIPFFRFKVGALPPPFFCMYLYKWFHLVPQSHFTILK